MDYLQEIRAVFEQTRNAEKAVGMKAYMKGKFEYYGVTSPERKEIQKIFFAEFKKQLDREAIWNLIFQLWEQPERELHYFAIDLLNSQPKKFLDASDGEKLEHLLATHSWWDSVDAIGSNYLGKYFAVFPDQKEKWIDKWRKGDNFWLHRSCMIFQLKYKDQLDFDLLTDLIRQFKGNKEFFIQKAIGWTLRQHTREDGQAVRDFVEEEQLVGLARREALRLLDK